MVTWFRQLLGHTKRELQEKIAALEKQYAKCLEEIDELLGSRRDLRKRFLESNKGRARAQKANSKLTLKLEATETELAETKDGLNAAIEQCDRLEKYLNDPKLLELELEPGGAIRMGLEPCIGAKVLAASFADMLGAAPNWQAVEIGPMPTDNGRIIVTAQRANGKSPVETVAELRERIKHLESVVETSGELGKEWKAEREKLEEALSYELKASEAYCAFHEKRVATLNANITALKIRLCRLADAEACLRDSLNSWRRQSIENHKRAEKECEHSKKLAALISVRMEVINTLVAALTAARINIHSMLAELPVVRPVTEERLRIVVRDADKALTSASTALSPEATGVISNSEPAQPVVA
jgi:chromosome segregation ATPase